MVADPLTIFDCAPISDGAASIILSTPEFAQQLLEKNPEQKIVYIIASGQASDVLCLSNRESLTEFKANQIAAKAAYQMSGIAPEQIDVAEIHDGFSITEIISLEDLGFFEKGQAGINTENGNTALNSKISINPSGGLKSKGHPVGATGVSQAYEIVMQLRGQAKTKQVKNAKIGLTHNMGGCGTTSVVHIFSKE
jgi:acetyl-CoA C-acetyltransferase